MPWSLRTMELCIAIALGMALYFSGVYSWLSESSLDALFRIRGSYLPSQQIVIVGIDEESLEKAGPWPFPRTLHAQLLSHLNGAKAIAFDLLLVKESEDDETLAKAIESGPPVILAVAKDYKANMLFPSKPLLQVATVGHIETQLGDSGVIRRVAMFLDGIPVLAAAMAPGRYNRAQNTAIINFYGPEFTFLYVSYHDVLTGRVAKDLFKNRYVLIGSKALALGDVHVTPYSSRFPIPGVELQATILSNLLENTLIVDASPLSYALTFLFLFLSWSVWKFLRESLKLVATLSAVAFICLVSYFSFISFVFINPVGPALAVIFSYIIHLSTLWIWVAARLVREIKILDKQLAQGLQQATETLPIGWMPISYRENDDHLAGGIHGHIRKMHDGIQALTLQNNFIKHLLSEETPPLALWQKYDGRLVLANSRFRESWEEIFGKKSPLPTLEEFGKFVDENTLESKENKECKDLSKVWFSAKAQDRVIDICSITLAGNLFHRVLVHHVQSSVLGFSGVLASFTNVTEIRNLERLKGEILNIVSHELRLPLTTIMGFSEMLTETLDGESKKFADEIYKQSKRFSGMIDDFLDIARMESGRYKMKIYPFDLIAIIHDAISGISQNAQQKNINIKHDLPARVSPISGDEVLLTQAILNILDNAVKFSPQNSTVTVSVAELENELEISVQDEGPGISMEEQKLIFEKFTRGKSQVKGDGFGLGLSLVQSVVDGHKGRISIESGLLNRGSRFTFTLPKKRE